MNTHDRAVLCPFCGKFNDMASNLPGQSGKPKPDDIFLCIGCGEWGIFAKTGGRKPNAEEYMGIATHEDCTRARTAWLRVQEKIKKTRQSGATDEHGQHTLSSRRMVRRHR